jgi:hypothetical protein
MGEHRLTVVIFRLDRDSPDPNHDHAAVLSNDYDICNGIIMGHIAGVCGVGVF